MLCKAQFSLSWDMTRLLHSRLFLRVWADSARSRSRCQAPLCIVWPLLHKSCLSRHIQLVLLPLEYEPWSAIISKIEGIASIPLLRVKLPGCIFTAVLASAHCTSRFVEISVLWRVRSPLLRKASCVCRNWPIQLEFISCQTLCSRLPGVHSRLHLGHFLLSRTEKALSWIERLLAFEARLV